jgi:GNAT superfamily N-acetyltransferase
LTIILAFLAHLGDRQARGLDRFLNWTWLSHRFCHDSVARDVREDGTVAEHIRKATAVDLPAVREIIDAAYGMYLSRMNRPPAPMLRDYAPAIEDGALWLFGNPPDALISLALADGGLLVENVAVHPRAQGAGLGRRLMEFAEAEAERLGLAKLSLYTNVVMTENQAIYAHLGYRETRRETEGGYHRVYMEKEI